MRQQIAMLADGRRLHLQDGPIDLIVEGFGRSDAVRTAYAAAARRFDGLLDELCAELALLRAPVDPDHCRLLGSVARRMHDAVAPFAPTTFITPMAAVAGAVAQEILDAMTDAADLARAYVNNGGDIALHLAPGERFTVGMVDRPDRPGLFGALTLRAEDRVRGLATSGWRGRSFSLGIADAVTVLARSAAQADAAATIVANAVDLPNHPAVGRRPAAELAPDNDLGARLVTRTVAALSAVEIAQALAAGAARARDLIADGPIIAAALHLQGTTQVVDEQRCSPPLVDLSFVMPREDGAPSTPCAKRMEPRPCLLRDAVVTGSPACAGDDNDKHRYEMEEGLR
ncbi:MAG: UPF0280 family protein [Xanthobacteraceae bacterium]